MNFNPSFLAHPEPHDIAAIVLGQDIAEFEVLSYV
jgi:hypothetical protein